MKVEVQTTTITINTIRRVEIEEGGKEQIIMIIVDLARTLENEEEDQITRTIINTKGELEKKKDDLMINVDAINMAMQEKKELLPEEKEEDHMINVNIIQMELLEIEKQLLEMS
jgi:hypothetical protein